MCRNYLRTGGMCQAQSIDVSNEEVIVKLRNRFNDSSINLRTGHYYKFVLLIVTARAAAVWRVYRGELSQLSAR